MSEICVHPLYVYRVRPGDMPTDHFADNKMLLLDDGCVIIIGMYNADSKEFSDMAGDEFCPAYWCILPALREIVHSWEATTGTVLPKPSDPLNRIVRIVLPADDPGPNGTKEAKCSG